MISFCGYCGFHGRLVFVHSHYQCPRCGINIAPCCEGENCEMPQTDPVTTSESEDHLSGSADLKNSSNTDRQV